MKPDKADSLPEVPPPPPPSPRKTLPWFIKLGPGQVFNRAEIKSLRRVHKRDAKSEDESRWVVTVDPEAVGGPQYNKIWIYEADAKRVCEALGVEYDEPKL